MTINNTKCIQTIITKPPIMTYFTIFKGFGGPQTPQKIFLRLFFIALSFYLGSNFSFYDDFKWVYFNFYKITCFWYKIEYFYIVKSIENRRI